MSNIRLFAAIALLAVLASCNEAQMQIPAPAENPDTEVSGLYTEGVLNVRLSEAMAARIASDLEEGRLSTKSSEINEFFSKAGVYSAERIFSDDERFLERQHREGLHLWYRIHFDPKSMPATRAADRILSIDGIEIAERQPQIRATGTNDPETGKQWWMYQPGGPDINVTGAWDNYGTGSSEVIVAVIDSGIDYTHEDLAACTLPGSNGQSHNFVHNTNTIHPMDHGTHVAGIIGAVRNNGKGIAGIAGGDASTGKAGVTLMSCQIFDRDETGREISVSSEDAMRYAADNGAVISQNSWGFNFDINDNGIIDANELENAKNFTLPAPTKAAIDYFIKYAGCDNDGNQLPDSPMKGGIVFFAAGNDNIQYAWPAQYDAVIAVGSMASDGSRSSFSNYGDWVDICAPGSGIYSTVPGGYGYMDGTSMACPMVSGVAALVVSHRGGIGFTNSELWDCIINGASYDNISCTNIGPLTDALAAVSYGLESAPEPITEIEAEAHSNTVSISWTVPDNGSGKAAFGAAIYMAKDKALLENLDPRKPVSGVVSSIVNTYGLQAGDKAGTSIEKLSFETGYYVTAISFNAGPAYSEQQAIVSVTTGKNNPPAIIADRPLDNLKIKASERISFTLTATDPDGHELRLTHQPASAGESALIKGNACTLYIDGSKTKTGTYTSKVIATDSYGLSAEFGIHYDILENTPPVVARQLPDILLSVEDGVAEIRLSEYFSDPDGDPLTFSAMTDNQSSALVTTGSGILYMTPQKSGASTVMVTASDPRKATASQSFMLAVRTKDQPVLVYPTQVTDKLNIATGKEEKETSVSVIAASGGNEVFSCKALSSAFSPIVADLSKTAPGRYFVKVEYGSESMTRAIVKL